MGYISFVILHYNSIEDTQKCIQSIKQLDGHQEIKVVIVDNASPNGTGLKLAGQYAGDEMVDVLCREENDGFPEEIMRVVSMQSGSGILIS